MAERFLLKQFAGNADNNQTFGSFQTGTPQPTNDPEQIQALPAWGEGWLAATTNATIIPRLEEMQGVQYVLCKALKELYSEGIPVWKAGETYYQYSIVSFVNEGVPVLYYNKTGTYTDADPTVDAENWERLSASSLQPCQIVSGFYSADWTPEGWHACDGTEFARAQFPEIYDNYLTATPAKAAVCTYAEYAAEINTYGQCAKFAVDTANQKFKVPTIKDGAAVNQALSAAEVGKVYSAGLPAIDIQTTGSGNATLYHIVGTYDAMKVASGDGTVGITRSVMTQNNPIYGASDTVRPEQVRLRHFVILANGGVNQSEMDWSAYMTALDGKANVSLSNINEDGRETIAYYAAPSNRFIDIALSVTSYTAPANGYVMMDNANTMTGWAWLKNTSNGMRTFSNGQNQVSDGCVFIPVMKGQVIQMNRSTNGTTAGVVYRFIYAEGAF